MASATSGGGLKPTCSIVHINDVIQAQADPEPVEPAPSWSWNLCFFEDIYSLMNMYMCVL